MASTIPPSGISLHGGAEAAEDLRPGTGSAILLKLGEDVVQELKSASKDELRFVTVSAPKLRIGGRTIDLSISPDAFRNELYASTTGASTTDLTFTSLVSHRAEPKSTKQTGASETAGTDAALAQLQNTLASYKQEKEANQTTITDKVLDVPKNRWDAARKEKLERKRRLLDSKHGSQPASPPLSSMGTPRLGAVPTSAPISEDEVRLKAMRKVLVHLLAIGPTTKEEIRHKTHIPKDDLDLILQKVGKPAEEKWQLSDRAYRELDVWSFGYPEKDDKQSAIDNAIRAYDRMRLGKDDKLWQLLLPEEERGKGKVLSRLHLNGVGQATTSLTPHRQPSPAPQHVNSGDEKKVASSANTPRLGSSTPRPTSSKGDVMKRLLSKDPQKAHRIEEEKMNKAKAAEQAKEKKRKEREEAASDKESAKAAKRQTTKKANPKVKSADIVRSSDDESDEDGEVKERPKAPPKPAGTAKKKAVGSETSAGESSDSAKPVKEVKKTATTTKAKAAATATKASASPAVKAAKPTPAATGKNTPQTNNGLSAPASQHMAARSPSAVGSRPGVPSPLGAARPRVASDVSDRNAVGVQRVRQGAETLKGLGITNGVKKRPEAVVSKGTATPNGATKPREKTAFEEAPKPVAASNGVATPKTNGAATAAKPAAGIKRKASDPPTSSQQSDSNKHRKTESTSSSSNNNLTLSATNSSTTSAATAPTSQTSPSASVSGSSSDNSAVLETISYKSGINLAVKFKTQFYPAYESLYDEVEGAQRRGEEVGRERVEQLRKMHGRLVEMKREIEAASRREE